MNIFSIRNLMVSILISHPFYLPIFSVSAQIVPDKTLPVNSLVTPQGTNNIIEGGSQGGSNLYHSFDQFSVLTGDTAFFNNPVNIKNIITRVTGGSASKIDGLIKANGGANLFFINPNGILFGHNAHLIIGGSFIASTANSINFPNDIQFSAKTPENTQLLSVNVPMGLEYDGNSSGSINVQGTGHSQVIYGNKVAASITLLGAGESQNGLRSQPGKTFALIGGDVLFDGGLVTAPSGQIEIGAVDTGIVNFTFNNSGLNLDYKGINGFKNISFIKQSLLDASGFMPGYISVLGKNINFTDGSLALIANLGAFSSGAIRLKATDTLDLTGITSFNIQPFLSATRINRGIITSTNSGRGADIIISASKIIAQDSEIITPLTFGNGNSGNLTIDASEKVVIRSVAVNESSGVASALGTITYGSGNAGDVILSTKELLIEDGGSLESLTFGDGRGGKVTVNASELLKISGGHPNFVLLAYGTPPIPTFSASNITSLSVSAGDAGDLSINTRRLIIENGAGIAASGLKSGNSGTVNINALESVNINGSSSVNPSLNRSKITSSVGTGDPFVSYIYNLKQPSDALSGNIFIKTGNLNLENNAQVEVRNDSTKNAGIVTVIANSISLDNQAGITASTKNGQGGNINLRTKVLNLYDNSFISATAGGIGNGGNITTNADIINVLGNSRITADAYKGRGGNIQINSQGFFASRDSQFTASSELGINGNVQFNILNDNIVPPKAIAETIQLPPEITSACQGNSRNAASKFVIIGTGNLPRSYKTQVSNNSGWHANSAAIATTSNNLDKQSLLNNEIKPIVEAQSVLIEPSGEVNLLASSNQVAAVASQLPKSACFATSSTSKLFP
ncbi:MAG: two-partner secretion domain-containing protein [Nostoc sp.]